LTAANLTVTSDNAVANGTATNGVQARVTDAHSNPVAGQSVSFTATNGATVTTVIGTTGADGIATATLTNTAAG
ncbi:Ig-like domain-containing protein, partial [Yersinia ruckeri]